MGIQSAPIGKANRSLRRPHEVASARVEYLVRTARITDIERLVALERRRRPGVRTGRARSDSADLLRQLVYLPQASIFIAEARREVVGGAVLALRPSVVAGGFVGTVDLLVVDPDHDVDRVTDALLEEVIRSAQNKGCSVVEAPLPTTRRSGPAWERHGFRRKRSAHGASSVAAVGAGTSTEQMNARAEQRRSRRRAERLTRSQGG